MFYQKSIQDILKEFTQWRKNSFIIYTKEHILKQNQDLAKAGLRVLAFVIKNITMKILLSLVLFP